jgi:hypothetical protein
MKNSDAEKILIQAIDAKFSVNIKLDDHDTKDDAQFLHFNPHSILYNPTNKETYVRGEVTKCMIGFKGCQDFAFSKFVSIQLLDDTFEPNEKCLNVELSTYKVVHPHFPFEGFSKKD